MKKKTTQKLLTVNWTKSKAYIGMKQIDAIPMDLGNYNIYRGWKMPDNEDPKAPGYIVRYPDNYVSWSPKKTFDEAYSISGSLTFGAAVYLMKQGLKLSREGWNGKGMWIIYVAGTKNCKLVPGTPYAKALPKRKQVDILPHFDMYTTNTWNKRAMLPGWLASQSDIDASDWGVVK